MVNPTLIISITLYSRDGDGMPTDEHLEMPDSHVLELEDGLATYANDWLEEHEYDRAGGVAAKADHERP